jgi:hypothetical protein
MAQHRERHQARREKEGGGGFGDQVDWELHIQGRVQPDRLAAHRINANGAGTIQAEECGLE